MDVFMPRREESSTLRVDRDDGKQLATRNARGTPSTRTTGGGKYHNIIRDHDRAPVFSSEFEPSDTRYTALPPGG